MPRRFTLAHISDVHLGPLPRFMLRHWNAKRVLGYVNWVRNRRRAHLPQTLARLVADLSEQAPEHVAVTGDLINIGLPEEYEAAARWLERLGAPERVSVVPGNHDIYTHLDDDIGVGRWSPYMRSTAPDALAPLTGTALETFPYVRRLGAIALIGLNSALPTGPFRAGGWFGAAQLGRLEATLRQLSSGPVTRVVLVHHPALPHQAPAAKALADAADLEDVIVRCGAELVLHGHNHRPMLAFRQGEGGVIPFVGVSSGSIGRGSASEALARYHIYDLEPGNREAPIELIARGLAEPEGAVVELERRLLIPVTGRLAGLERNAVL